MAAMPAEGGRLSVLSCDPDSKTDGMPPNRCGRGSVRDRGVGGSNPLAPTNQHPPWRTARPSLQLFFDVTVNTLIQTRSVVLFPHLGQVAECGAFDMGRRTSKVLRHFLQLNS